MADTPQKVLIVEDDPLLQKALHDKFIREGFDVSTASDGIDGLRLVEKFQPHLLLLDIKMPKMDGLVFLEELRKLPTGVGLPVIILTNSDADDAIIQKIVMYHPAYYFLKADMQMNDLFGKVKELLAVAENDRL